VHAAMHDDTYLLSGNITE